MFWGFFPNVVAMVVGVVIVACDDDALLSRLEPLPVGRCLVVAANVVFVV